MDSVRSQFTDQQQRELWSFTFTDHFQAVASLAASTGDTGIVTELVASASSASNHPNAQALAVMIEAHASTFPPSPGDLRVW